tara:strand:- start:377 stop:1480 length:1104 start_codon:yes stop_codon:yes gene_type:complete
MKLSKIIQSLEDWAPSIYQEPYDNSGLIIGDSNSDISGCLITLDITEEVVDEAIKKNCNLIISHHPILFKSINKINFSNWESRVIRKSIQNNINIYSLHTNLDNISNGVNKKICDILKINNTEILKKKENISCKLEIYIPEKYKDEFLKNIYNSGGGIIGNYNECSFQMKGKGTFRPNKYANPRIGRKNQKQSIDEVKLEIFFNKNYIEKIENCINEFHPYDHPTYSLNKNLNSSKNIGSGMVGNRNIEFKNLLKEIIEYFNVKSLKHTKVLKRKINKIAVCGGSGSFLIEDAISSGADVYITSDIKYHDFFKADNKIIIIDIGHYEGEQFTKDLIYEYLSKKFLNIAIYLSKMNTNPINYQISYGK